MLIYSKGIVVRIPLASILCALSNRWQRIAVRYLPVGDTIIEPVAPQNVQTPRTLRCPAVLAFAPPEGRGGGRAEAVAEGEGEKTSWLHSLAYLFEATN